MDVDQMLAFMRLLDQGDEGYVTADSFSKVIASRVTSRQALLQHGLQASGHAGEGESSEPLQPLQQAEQRPSARWRPGWPGGSRADYGSRVGTMVDTLPEAAAAPSVAISDWEAHDSDTV